MPVFKCRPRAITDAAGDVISSLNALLYRWYPHSSLATETRKSTWQKEISRYHARYESDRPVPKTRLAPDVSSYLPWIFVAFICHALGVIPRVFLFLPTFRPHNCRLVIALWNTISSRDIAREEADSRCHGTDGRWLVVWVTPTSTRANPSP